MFVASKRQPANMASVPGMLAAQLQNVLCLSIAFRSDSKRMFQRVPVPVAKPFFSFRFFLASRPMSWNKGLFYLLDDMRSWAQN